MTNVNDITPQQQKKAELFYKEVLKILTEEKVPFLIGGTYAWREYTGINRPTHDFDLFCKNSDVPNLIRIFNEKGYKCEVDDRWICKIYKGDTFVDIIFSTVSGLCPIDDSWFVNTGKCTVFGYPVQLMPLEELIWSKAFIQDRYRYDGPDVYHLILRKGKKINWKHLLQRMEAYWEILLAHLINFRFIYPSDRENVPKWVMEELLKRTSHSLSMPNAVGKICRGRLLSHNQYEVDVTELGYQDKDIII